MYFFARLLKQIYRNIYFDAKFSIKKIKKSKSFIFCSDLLIKYKKWYLSMSQY